jgi:hypothetical protein
MKIYKNGELVENYRNDLHNTFSPKHHIPHFVPSYKNLYRNQLCTNKGLLFSIAIILIFSFLIGLGFNYRIQKLTAEITALKAQIETGATVAAGYADYSTQLETGLVGCYANLPQRKVITGKVSYYSQSGCLGCSPNQKMANGEIFNEDANTIAFNKAPLNTWVTVKNTDNGKSIQARVTDRGGFEKYNRIADLSKMVCEYIECKTDISTIEFSWN